MKKHSRRQLYVESNVQGVLLRRAMVYFVACVLFTVLPICLGRVIHDPSHLFFEGLWPFLKSYSSFFICLLLLTPLLAYDILRLSNRIAGPVYRLRRELQKLANGEKAHPLKFRKGDSWLEMAPAFNTVLERIESLEQAVREMSERTDETVSV